MKIGVMDDDPTEGEGARTQQSWHHLGSGLRVCLLFVLDLPSFFSAPLVGVAEMSNNTQSFRSTDKPMSQTEKKQNNDKKAPADCGASDKLALEQRGYVLKRAVASFGLASILHLLLLVLDRPATVVSPMGVVALCSFGLVAYLRRIRWTTKGAAQGHNRVRPATGSMPVVPASPRAGPG